MCWLLLSRACTVSLFHPLLKTNSLGGGQEVGVLFWSSPSQGAFKDIEEVAAHGEWGMNSSFCFACARSFYFSYWTVIILTHKSFFPACSPGKGSEQKAGWAFDFWPGSSYHSSLQLVLLYSELELLIKREFCQQDPALTSCIFKILTFPLWPVLGYVWETVWAKLVCLPVHR